VIPQPWHDQEKYEPFFGGRGWHPGARLARAAAMRARRAEHQFAIALRRLAAQIGHIVLGIFDPEEPASTSLVEEALAAYEDLIGGGWAQRVAARLLADVSRRDAAGWHQLGKQIARGLKAEVEAVPMQPTIAQLLADQVELITSLPAGASERVHTLSVEAMTGGRRWEEVAKDILATGEVSRSRANLIARTETSRAASEIQATRAQGVGSEGGIWRTARDRDVRPLHRDLEGVYFRWDNPPILDDGRPGLPGTIWSCRCFTEIVLPGQDITARLGPLPRNPAYLAALRQQGYTTGAAFE
jgi:SPP1 gp7 family putative phage head morphogenesis protein